MARLSRGALRGGRYAMEAVSHLELSGIFYHCNASATAVPQAAVMVRAAARPARPAATPGSPVAAAAASPGLVVLCDDSSPVALLAAAAAPSGARFMLRPYSLSMGNVSRASLA